MWPRVECGGVHGSGLTGTFSRRAGTAWRLGRDEAYKWARWKEPPRTAGRRLARKYGLRVLDELQGRSSAAVLRVADQEDQARILKLEGRQGEAATEYRALEAWQGQGLVPDASLLGPGVLLLEEVEGSGLSRVSALTGGEANLVGNLLRELHRHESQGFPELWAHVAERQQTIATTRRLPGEVQSLATHAYRSLAQLPRGRALLHGDLHAGNIVITSTGARVIDPYGLAGDPAYDVAFVAATSALLQEDTLRRLQTAYQANLPGLDQWFRWVAVYRLDNAIRNGLMAESELRLLVARLVTSTEVR